MAITVSESSASISSLFRPDCAIEVVLQLAEVIEFLSGLANHRTSIAIRRYPERFVRALASDAREHGHLLLYSSMRGRKPAIIIMANTPAVSRAPPFLSIFRCYKQWLPLFAHPFYMHSVFPNFRPSRRSYSSTRYCFLSFYYYFRSPCSDTLHEQRAWASSLKNSTWKEQHSENADEKIAFVTRHQKSNCNQLH